jgi:hypothetical protein
MHLNTVVPVVFLSMLLMSCDLLTDVDLERDTALDVRAGYATSHPWTGKCARFELPMAYLTNLPPGFNYKEKMGVDRMLLSKDEADYLQKITKDSIVTPVQPGTTFEVVAVYTVVHSGISLIFNSDYKVAVLRDNHGQVSAEVLSSLKPCS